MKKLLLLIIFKSYIFSAGFSEKTLLLTDQGQLAFDEVDCDTSVQSDENHFQPVLFLSKHSVEKVIQISITDEIIIKNKGLQQYNLHAMVLYFLILMMMMKTNIRMVFMKMLIIMALLKMAAKVLDQKMDKKLWIIHMRSKAVINELR